MKKSVLAIILILGAFFGVYGQSSTSLNNTPMDVVLILDTSSGMSSSYENVNNYITGSFLSEYLRVGDTFHLIAFSGSPKLDIARRITSLGDVETIIGRMLLQYPVESENNIGSAISFAEQYITSLPTRPKKIVLVSTGDASSLVSAARARLSSRNTTIDFVQVVPGQALSNLPSSGRPQGSAAAVASTQTSTAAQTTTPAQTTAPAQTTTQTTTPAQTATTPQSTASEQTSTTPSSQAGTTVQSSEGTSTLSETTQSGTSGTTTETARETQSVTPSPLSTTQQKDSGAALASSMPLIIGLIVLALIVLGVIVFFASRRLGSSPNRVMAQVASSKPQPREDMTPFVDHSKDLAKYAASQTKQRSTPYENRPMKIDNSKSAVINPSGPLLLNLFVEDQNTAIGKRNIHSLKSGYTLSVGGGQSDFLVFLVPVPANIGEIRRNGSQCSFVPRKPKYFPDLGSNELRDCINKTIRVVSDKDYEVRFRFEMYEDPLIALNRLLMSVNVPG